MLTLNYRDSRPIYEQIKDGLRRMIVTGAMQQDEKLPSVRALATQLSINPNTIQRAYHRLEQEGYTVLLPGKGCFAAAAPAARQERMQLLWLQLETAAAELRFAGVSQEEILQRIAGTGGSET